MATIRYRSRGARPRKSLTTRDRWACNRSQMMIFGPWIWRHRCSRCATVSSPWIAWSKCLGYTRPVIVSPIAVETWRRLLIPPQLRGLSLGSPCCAGVDLERESRLIDEDNHGALAASSFDARPVSVQPGPDHLLVAFGGPDGWQMGRPAQVSEASREVIQMVRDSEAWCWITVRILGNVHRSVSKPECSAPRLRISEHLAPVGGCQPRRTTRPAMTPQSGETPWGKRGVASPTGRRQRG